MPSSDDRNAILTNDFCGTFDVKHERRIVDFQEPAGELRVAQHEQCRAHLTDAVVLGRSQFQRLAQREALRRSSRQAAGFQFG